MAACEAAENALLAVRKDSDPLIRECDALLKEADLADGTRGLSPKIHATTRQALESSDAEAFARALKAVKALGKACGNDSLPDKQRVEAVRRQAILATAATGGLVDRLDEALGLSPASGIRLLADLIAIQKEVEAQHAAFDRVRKRLVDDILKRDR